ncbi:MAG: hypothetical protein QXW10_03845, partial [Candidatus Micrarchaeaceae archaeon]
MLSLLIFSMNDTANALDLAASMLSSVDQVVIVDSSDGKEHKRLVEKSRKYHKIEVYYTLPLGYVEPFRFYGTDKCKGEWILYLDTDERLGKEFAENLGEIVKNADCDGFAVKRYEESTAASHTQFFTWQIRLFRKSKVSFKGMIHEQATIKGRLCTLSDDYCIMHRTDLMHHEKNDYGKMMLFEMLSYNGYKSIMLDYARKFFALDTNSVKGRFIFGFFGALLDFYIKVTFKKPESEIGRNDYLWFYFIRTIAYAHRHG